MKKNLSTVIFVIIFVVGLSVMLYPSFSNWWNLRHQSRAVANYKETVAQMNSSQTEQLFAEAHRYNAQLAKLSSPFHSFEEVKGYDDILNVSGTGIMGYISIPSIQVELPIYHGTSEGVLQIAAGHIQGSSLPIGERNAHAVISGHRGLPSARLFTDLDKMVVGDTFTVNILNEVFTYEVEQILIILPDESDKLEIIPNEDYVTLMTCTPYGINSHRLLLRSKRIGNIEERQRSIVSADAVQVDPMQVLPFVCGIMFVIMVLGWKVTGRNRKKLRIDKNIIYKI